MKIRLDNQRLHVETDSLATWFTLDEAAELHKFLVNHRHQLTRLRRPNKDWNLCPYEAHHDSCTCHGQGGDR